MKNFGLFCFLSIALLCTGSVSAQLFSGDPNGKDSTLPKIEFGLKAGLNMQSVTGNLWVKDYNAGFTGGMFLQMRKNKIAGSVEILASTARYTSIPLNDTNGSVQPLRDSMGNRGDFRTASIDIPVLVKYYAIPWLSVHAGIQYSSLVSLNNLNNFSGDVKKLFKRGSFSGIIGLEANLPAKILVGGRYVYGFSDINNQPISNMPGSWTTSAIQVYVGYRIQ